MGMQIDRADMVTAFCKTIKNVFHMAALLSLILSAGVAALRAQSVNADIVSQSGSVVSRGEDSRIRHNAKAGSGGSLGEDVFRSESHVHQRFETVVKRESEEIRSNIRRAKEYLADGDADNARKYAYRAWSRIPHDTEVAVLIADINREAMFGSEVPPDEYRDGRYVLQETVFPAERDPLRKYDERKSLADFGEYLLVDVPKKIFGGETFEVGEPDLDRVLTIEDCVDIALSNNQRLIVLDEQVKFAEWRLWEARRKFLPEVSLKYERSFGKVADPATAFFGATRHYQGEKYKADIKQTLFDGFGTFFDIQQRQTALDIVKLEIEKVRNEIVEETEKAYYNLDKAEKNVSVQKGFKEKVDEMYRIMSRAFQLALIPEVDYLKVKGQRILADFQYVSSSKDADMARMILVQAMDIDPDRYIEIEPVERPENLLQIGLQNCYNLALANNPVFQIKKRTIEHHNFERKIAKAKGWPKIDFQGSFGKAGEFYQPMRDASDYTGNPARAHTGLEPEWYAGIKGSVPFWGSTFEYNYVREFWASTVSAFRGTESATSYFTLKILDDLAYFTNAQESRVGFEMAKRDLIKEKNDLAVKVKGTHFKYRKAVLNMDVAAAQFYHQQMFVDVLEEQRKFGDMEISRLVEEYLKLAEYEYAMISADSDYLISITELNSNIGVPGYFDPWMRPRYDFYRQEAQGTVREKEAHLIKEGQKLKTTAEQNAEIAARYLEQARTELGRSNFARARRLAIRAAETDPGNPDGKDMLGTIDQAEGLYRARRR